MAERLSRGPLQVVSNDPLEINDALRRIRQELDEAQGLNGRARIFDRVGIGAPQEAGDAAQLGDTGAALTVVALRVVDTNGTLIHSLGSKT